MVTTDVVKAFDKIPHAFVIKYVSKIGIQEFLKPDKNIYQVGETQPLQALQAVS